MRPEAPQKPRLDLLDYLRFAAAMMVVSYHYPYAAVVGGHLPRFSLGPASEVTRYGYLGVELFFLISGFVIVHSARGKLPSQFLVSRAVRLFPAYWAAVVLTALVIAVGGRAAHLHVGWAQVAWNLTMAAGLFGVVPVDGVYWTLYLELLFYAAVLGALLLGRGRWLSTAMPLWAIVILSVNVSAYVDASTPYRGGFFALFASGGVMAAIRAEGWTPLRGLGLGAGYAAVAWTSGLYALKTSHYLDRVSPHQDHRLSVPVVLVVVTIFFLLVGSLCIPGVAWLRLPHAAAVGALTYPLYLVHEGVGWVVLAHVPPAANQLVVLTALTIVMLALARAIHRWVELAPRAFWLRLFGAVLGRPMEAWERAAGLSLRDPTWSARPAVPILPG